MDIKCTELKTEKKIGLVFIASCELKFIPVHNTHKIQLVYYIFNEYLFIKMVSTY